MRMIVLVVSLFAIAVTPALFGDAHGETLIQCMEKCVQYEGGNSAANKATCKNRCGGERVKIQPADKRDCMAEFKSCNTKCGKEIIGQPSPCLRECKAGLRTCG